MDNMHLTLDTLMMLNVTVIKNLVNQEQFMIIKHCGGGDDNVCRCIIVNKK